MASRRERKAAAKARCEQFVPQAPPPKDGTLEQNLKATMDEANRAASIVANPPTCFQLGLYTYHTDGRIFEFLVHEGRQVELEKGGEAWLAAKAYLRQRMAAVAEIKKAEEQ